MKYYSGDVVVLIDYIYASRFDKHGEFSLMLVGEPGEEYIVNSAIHSPALDRSAVCLEDLLAPFVWSDQIRLKWDML